MERGGKESGNYHWIATSSKKKKKEKKKRNALPRCQNGTPSCQKQCKTSS